MSNLVNKAMIYTSFWMYQTKEGVKRFLKEEKGGSEILSVIVLVAIAVLLAVFFRNQLGDLVENIWEGISGKTDEITADF